MYEYFLKNQNKATLLSEMLMSNKDKITSWLFSFILLISFQASVLCFDAQRLRCSFKNDVTNTLKEVREKNPSLQNSADNQVQFGPDL